MKYEELVEYYEKLENTSKRLEKTKIVCELLKKCSEKEIDKVILLLEGRVFPKWKREKIGVAGQLVVKAISKVSGESEKEVEALWGKVGDLGEVGESLINKRKQSTLFMKKLRVNDVFAGIQRIAEQEGKGAVGEKIKIISNLLSNGRGKEIRYIIRTLLEDLRIGIGRGTIRDAIVWAYLYDVRYDKKENNIEVKDRKEYNEIVEKVQEAYDRTNDFSIVAKKASKGLGEVEGIGIKVDNPLNVMLAQREKTIEDAMKRLQGGDKKKKIIVEYKYDGFRVQIHKKGEDVRVFTRRLEEVTKQFPDIVEAVKENIKCKDCILDGEAVGFDPRNGKYRPFQEISQRIKRKYDIKKLMKEVPVEVNLFDVIEFNGKSMLKSKLKEREEVLDRIVKERRLHVVKAKRLVSSDARKIKKFYKEALEKGHEGIMLKDPDYSYKPGARVGGWIKFKPIMDTLDLVVVKAEWGTGKRGGWLTSYTLACLDENGELAEVGKVSTGIKELEKEGLSYGELTKKIKPLIEKEEGREVLVKPKIVLEIAYEEIQKSPSYGSGFALRFPRVIKLREDKGVEDASTITEVEKLYRLQKKR